MKSKIFFTGIFLIVAAWFVSPVAFAAVAIDPNLYPKNTPTVSDQKPTGNTAAEAAPEYASDSVSVLLLEKITNVILGIAGVVAIFFILNNAWYLVIAGGAEEQISQHKKGLMWAVVGLILIILSYSIVRFVISIPFQADEEVIKLSAPPPAGASAPAPSP